MEPYHISKSAEMVGSIDDLLTKVLLFLPIKSLIRFKSVSHHWVSLISDPKFCCFRSPKPNPAIGLIWNAPLSNVDKDEPYIEYIPFGPEHSTHPPFTREFQESYPCHGSVLASCNGLLLCSSNPKDNAQSEPKYYVYNPTTNQYAVISSDYWPLEMSILRGISLAFDPVKSTHYHVVFVLLPCYNHEVGDEWIEIFSSETGTWNEVYVKSHDLCHLDLQNGVYWNGSVHWRRRFDFGHFLFFNIDNQVLDKMPSPPMMLGWYNGRNVYFGESCDHLHCVYSIEVGYSHTSNDQVQSYVYEMKRDYSEWFVKYHVDLSEVVEAYPCSHLISSSSNYYPICLMCFVDQDDDNEEPFLVLRRLDKVVKYKMVSKSFEKLNDHFAGGRFINVALGGFRYIESLFSVC